MRSIVLTDSQFEIAFQVTYQATNFDELRLRKLGITPDDLEWLIVALRSAHDEVDRAAKVRIEFQDPSPEGERDVASAATMPHESDPADVVRIGLPAVWASRWPLLTELVMSSLSHRELFLRTGYQWHEMESAVQRLEGAS
ncbi:hypothetical protein AB0H28_28110 [Micromonospora sp. NPDC050980]|uniref:hypothetical protein n=1 Tax=Micromonospora sp. NPDC050980 TaxID=3155161 RepID=UPI0033F2BA41